MGRRVAKGRHNKWINKEGNREPDKDQALRTVVRADAWKPTKKKGEKKKIVPVPRFVFHATPGFNQPRKPAKGNQGRGSKATAAAPPDPLGCHRGAAAVCVACVDGKSPIRAHNGRPLEATAPSQSRKPRSPPWKCHPGNWESVAARRGATGRSTMVPMASKLWRRSLGPPPPSTLALAARHARIQTQNLGRPPGNHSHR